MTTLTDKANISGSPSRATANAGFGALWDFINERFFAGTATAAEKAVSRGALGAARGREPVTAAAAANALTITLNPTALDFRSGTLGDGAITTLTVAAAISLTISSGSTLGTTNGSPARIGVLAINNAGTVELAAVNLDGGTYLDEAGVISTSAEGGSGGADSATTIYSTAARSNVPFRLLKVIDITQATAGTWASQPTRVYDPGDTVATRRVAQVVSAQFGAVATGTTTIPFDDTIPQNTEGDEYMTLSITPKDANSLLVIEADGFFATTAGSGTGIAMALFKDSAADALAVRGNSSASANYAVNVSLAHTILAGSTSTQTFKIRAGASAAGTTTFNGSGGTRRFGGVMASGIRITEYLPPR